MKTLTNLKNNLIITGVVFVITSTLSLAHFGPRGPYTGGYISCGIVNDTTVYLGTMAGGVFESTNSKLIQWRPRPVGLKSGKINALAHTGKYLFAATDSGVFRFTGFVGSDRYWEKVNTGISNLKVRSLVAIDSITLLAGTEGSGLFRTSDKGANWTAISSASLNSAVITAMVKAGNRIILASESGGVFASDDKGLNWMDFNDASTLNIAGTVSISYNAVTDQLMVTNNNGLFVAGTAATAASATYSAAQTGLPSPVALRSISNNGTHWYLATDKGVYASVTGVINWAAENAGLSTMDVTAVVPFQTRLVAGTNLEGIFKSDNVPVSWTVMNTSFSNLRTYSMMTQGAALLIAATEKGVHVSKDLGSSYTSANKGLTDSLNVTDLTFFGTVLLATTKNAGVFMSADTGKNWTTANTGLTNLSLKKVFASSSYAYLISSAGEVYQSNLSTGWTSIQTGLPAGVIPTSMAFHGNNIILGTMGLGVFHRQESGGGWGTQFPSGLTNLNVTSVTLNGSKMFAGTDGSGVFVSDIAIENWSPTASTATAISHTALMDLDGSKIQAMAYNAGYVFASYKGGLLATSDNGATWIEAGNQFNLPSFTDVNKITFVTTRVFVTTENNCLYSNSLSELPPLGIFETKAFDKNSSVLISPNPSNGNFNITLKDRNAEIREIAIYDNMGRLVEKISVDKAQRSVNIVSNYSPGIYFIRIKTKLETATRKVIIE